MRQQYGAAQLERRRRRQRRRRRTTLTFLACVVAVGLWQGGGALARDALRLDRDRPAPVPTALDPRVEERFTDAQDAAGAEGVELTITSGWRSVDDQQLLVDEMVSTYGSVEEARRWVLPPEKSAHVAGLAIDVGPRDGAAWLEERSLDFGLCRTYDNEWWHFELMPDGGTCPERWTDSSWGW